MTAKKESVAAAKPRGLIGRCFVTFQPERQVNHQGIVRARITYNVYLVQFFDWIAGEPNTLQLVRLEDMLATPATERDSGSWMFFDDTEHLRHWMEYVYREPKISETKTTPQNGGIGL